MNKSASLWKFEAPVYRIFRNNPVSGYFLKKELDSLQDLVQQINLEKIKSVCDLGVGRGHSLDIEMGSRLSKIAIDKSASMVWYTRKDYPDTFFLVGDVLNLPLKNSILDCMFCIGLTEYISNIELLLHQISLTLKTDGHLLITFSPKNIFTYLRFLNGHWLYPRDCHEMERHFHTHHFKIIEARVTAMQHQFLLQKSES